MQALSRFFLLLVLFLSGIRLSAQERSVVIVHTDKGSGYGVAWGSPDKIVTVLHVVAGANSIQVNWEGKTSVATVEKIYKPSDLALLSLKTPLGIPLMKSYSGEAPLKTTVQYWTSPPGQRMTGQNTQLEKKSTLEMINPRVDAAGFDKMLCSDGSRTFPATSTTVIKFAEANIAKSHSGSPITYGTDILGLIDGGSKVPNTMVWAIPCSEFNKLTTMGTPPLPLASCANSKYMYSGMRSDNPLLDPQHAELATQIETAKDFTYKDASGEQISFSLEYRIQIRDIMETGITQDMKPIRDMFAVFENYVREAVNGGMSAYGNDIPQGGESPLLREEELMDVWIDIFREDNSGVLIAVPTGLEIFARDEAGLTMLHVKSPEKLIQMNFLDFPAQNMEDARSVLQTFKEILRKDECPVDKPEIDDYSDNEDNPYYQEWIDNNYTDPDGNDVGKFLGILTINDSDFLGVTVDSRDYVSLWSNKKERLYNYSFVVCAYISGYPVN